MSALENIDYGYMITPLKMAVPSNSALFEGIGGDLQPRVHAYISLHGDEGVKQCICAFCVSVFFHCMIQSIKML